MHRSMRRFSGFFAPGLWMLLIGLAALTIILQYTQHTPSIRPNLEQCSTMPITIAPRLVADVAGHTTQAKVNCFAWQTFIALNWPASATQRGLPDSAKTSQTFGDAAEFAPTVWQSYKSAPEVMLPNAQPPSAWNSLDSIPPICQASGNHDLDWPLFRMDSETTARIPTTKQATDDVLVDQSGNPVYYETRLNQDEFNYIVQNQLYDALQQEIVARTQGISLPAGKTIYGDDGAIEIKAAWRILDGQPLEVRQRYKQTRAFLFNSDDDTCIARTLGLVGLHIIRKTRSMPDLMWSTFEQIDNVPSNASTPNLTSVPAVFSVARAEPIPPDVQALNAYVQGLIREENPDSVWQYYQLINVRWPAVVGDAAPSPGATIPLNVSHEQFISSSLQPVSNATLETFAQQTDCLSCHICAAIASRDSSRQNECNRAAPHFASDFSFLFSEAAMPSVVSLSDCGNQNRVRYNFQNPWFHRYNHPSSCKLPG